MTLALMVLLGCPASHQVVQCGASAAAGVGGHCGYVVIEGGFSCPSALSFRTDLPGLTVCSPQRTPPTRIPASLCQLTGRSCDELVLITETSSATCDAARRPVRRAQDVDLLFVIDDSRSMAEEQEALAAEIPRFLDGLATGDIDGDGELIGEEVSFGGVRSLHVGVVTTDMGIGTGVDFGAPSVCPSSRPQGDNGLLQAMAGPGTGNSCSVPGFLAFDPSSDDLSVATDQLACAADVGVDGCALEQPLEAMLKAVTPAEFATRFIQRNGETIVSDSAGHAGGGQNGGFFRPDALLAIVVITDEDDCSTEDMLLFDVLNQNDSAPYPVPFVEGRRAPQLQCATYRDANAPISRYVSGLLALRDDPSRVLFATLSGVAPDLLERAETSADFFGTVLDDASMVEELDPATAMEPAQPDLRASCTRPNPDNPDDPNIAYPPRRLVQVARELDAAGAAGIVESICRARDREGGDFAADFSPALLRIMDEVSKRVAGECIPL